MPGLQIRPAPTLGNALAVMMSVFNRTFHSLVPQTVSLYGNIHPKHKLPLSIGRRKEINWLLLLPTKVFARPV
jgi:hypothetical protein